MPAVGCLGFAESSQLIVQRRGVTEECSICMVIRTVDVDEWSKNAFIRHLLAVSRSLQTLVSSSVWNKLELAVTVAAY